MVLHTVHGLVFRQPIHLGNITHTQGMGFYSHILWGVFLYRLATWVVLFRHA